MSVERGRRREGEREGNDGEERGEGGGRGRVGKEGEKIQ